MQPPKKEPIFPTGSAVHTNTLYTAYCLVNQKYFIIWNRLETQPLKQELYFWWCHNSTNSALRVCSRQLTSRTVTLLKHSKSKYVYKRTEEYGSRRNKWIQSRRTDYFPRRIFWTPNRTVMLTAICNLRYRMLFMCVPSVWPWTAEQNDMKGVKKNMYIKQQDAQNSCD